MQVTIKTFWEYETALREVLTYKRGSEYKSVQFSTMLCHYASQWGTSLAGKQHAEMWRVEEAEEEYYAIPFINILPYRQINH